MIKNIKGINRFFDEWRCSKGGHIYNFSGFLEGAGNRQPYCRINGDTKVIELFTTERSKEPIDYKATKFKMQAALKEFFNPKKYLFLINEESMSKGYYIYTVEFYCMAEKPSNEKMQGLRKICQDIVTADIEDCNPHQ